MRNRKQFYIKYIFIITLIFTVLTSCKKEIKKNNTQEIVSIENTIEETLYRPNFHFTPKANWMNDPNGMFYLNGKYHLYFQYYPDGNVWGPMHWGHAVSEDMITWEEQAIALYPDDLGLIFSGSAVVDKNNTSGFGRGDVSPIVAIYTYHNMGGEKAGELNFQTQAIAFSLDEGMTWTKYDDNPVISNPGIKDFRDPKVIWDDKNDRWIMALAAGNKIMFYGSTNLKEWNLESEFGKDVGQHDGIWECPDLFPIKIEGTDKTKWVLIVSINPGAPNGGSGTQYFVGDFDGNKFTLDADFKKQLKKQKSAWLDYGRDNYAGVTWSNISESDGRKLFMGWMSNWEYARDVPTETWRSAMTIARELKLKKFEDNYSLLSTPVSELSKYVSNTILKDTLIVNKQELIISENEADLARLSVQFEMKNFNENKYTFLFHNKFGDSLSFGIDNIEKHYFINRQKSGKVNFSDKFANNISKAKKFDLYSTLNVQILMDKTSIEVFYNEGEVVMTEIFFPNEPFETLSIITSEEKLILENIKIKEFKLK